MVLLCVYRFRVPGLSCYHIKQLIWTDISHDRCFSPHQLLSINLQHTFSLLQLLSRQFKSECMAVTGWHRYWVYVSLCVCLSSPKWRYFPGGQQHNSGALLRGAVFQRCLCCFLSSRHHCTQTPQTVLLHFMFTLTQIGKSAGFLDRLKNTLM